MVNEVAVPQLPCRSIDEITTFYGALGFRTTYRQTRPNPYAALRREDLEMHFFAIEGFDPADCYGACALYVPDTGALHRAFTDGLRSVYGKVPVRGIPRLTTPRRRKNDGRRTGFTMVDPGGNWIRVFNAVEKSAPEVAPAATGKLATALENAVVLGDSKGDTAQAVKILDANLAREQATALPVDLVEALVYRAELALRQAEPARARALLARVRAVPLEEDERRRLADSLTLAEETSRDLAPDASPRRYSPSTAAPPGRGA
ncbi:VOC family protein [Streptomyces alfalfae]|uniref:VOC family protein n=1 Tax=Streptomyces alfalfae TaxID=1642299 RepID=UPI001BA4AAB2|nr:VOC family protein [Streptomyces alfalfae]